MASIGALVAAVLLMAIVPIILARLKTWLPKIDILIGCYLIGGVIGQTPLPRAAGASVETIASATVIFGLPCILLCANLPEARRTAGPALLAMVLGSVCMVAAVAVAYCVVVAAGLDPHDTAVLTGLMTAVGSGGTPNMAAVRVATGVRTELYIACHTAEMAVGALYLLFMMTASLRVGKLCMRSKASHAVATACSSVAVQDNTRARSGSIEGSEVAHVPLDASQQPGQPANAAAQPAASVEMTGVPRTSSKSPLQPVEDADPDVEDELDAQENAMAELAVMQEDIRQLAKREAVVPTLKSAGVTLVIVAIGAGIPMFAFKGEAAETIAPIVQVLAVTSMALAASFVPAIRQLPYSFPLGHYFVYMFCVGMGMLADVAKLLSGSPLVLLFVAICMPLATALHAGVCLLLRIDVETWIVTSMAGMLSPPFVPLGTRAAKAPHLMVPGITAGLLGYAYGSYLGLGIAEAFKSTA